MRVCQNDERDVLARELGKLLPAVRETQSPFLLTPSKLDRFSLSLSLDI